eukprot:6742138-Heterocapsa_arctica.AAC.1
MEQAGDPRIPGTKGIPRIPRRKHPDPRLQHVEGPFHRLHVPARLLLAVQGVPAGRKAFPHKGVEACE